MKGNPMQDKKSQFLLYTTDTGDVKLEVFLQDETIWLSQKMMAELFDVDRTVITKHVANVFGSGELDENSNVQKLHVAYSAKPVSYYNLDVIISVGYRVSSKRATQFRIWASKVLKEYIVKGFALDDDRLKQGETVFGQDYFKQLLERIRSIRSSERRIYLQITDIFAECSTDYNPKSKTTNKFFATVQNKFHYAITGQTASEIVYNLADANKPNMGLNTWHKSPDGRVLKTDATVAKNYLSESDIKKLERTISSFFDYIEGIVERKQTFTMSQFADSVNKFLAFNEYAVLNNAGSVSHTKAVKKAERQYDAFNKIQKIDSDFSKHLNKPKKLKE